MRDSCDIESQTVGPIDLDQRRPSRGPLREPLDQRRIPARIGGNRDQCRVERPCVGQPRADSCAPLGSGFRHCVDDRPVRAFDGQDDRFVRR
jgi:hypothetical protein